MTTDQNQGLSSPGERLQNSILWGAALSGVIRVGQVLVSLILVRLLTPEIYGQYGLLNAVLTFVYVLSMQRFMEFSFHQSDAELNIDAQLSFGVLLHIALFLLVNCASLGLLLSDHYQVIAPYLSVASLGILLNIPRIFHSVLLQRDQKWQRIRTLHFISFLFSSLVAVFAARQGYGLWALVVHSLLVPVPFVIDGLNRLSRTRFLLPGAAFLPTLKFGIIRNATSGVSAGQGLIESSLLTLIVGFASFGLYGRALALAQLLTGAATQPLSAILYPALAREHLSNESVASVTGLLLRVALWIGLPMVILMVQFPTLIVTTAFGEEWLAVAPMLPFAGVLVMAQVVRQMLTMVLTSRMMTRTVLVQELLILLLTGVTIYLVKGELMVYLMVMMIAYWLINFCLMGLMLKRGIATLSDQVNMMLGLLLVMALVLSGIWFGSSSGWLDRLPDYVAAIGQALFLIVCVLIGIRVADAQALKRLLGYLPGAPVWRRVFLF